MAIEMPHVSRHPNRQPFRGVLTLVDAPSTRPPSGARGHRVLLSRVAADRALASLLGMALDYTLELDGHDARRKVGIITEAFVAPASGRLSREHLAPAVAGGTPATTAAGTAALHVNGYLFARDFPELMRELRSNGRGLGMSYEIADAHVADVRASIWVLTDVTFTGAAILRREKAAYPDTWIELETSSVAGSRSSAVKVLAPDCRLLPSPRRPKRSNRGSFSRRQTLSLCSIVSPIAKRWRASFRPASRITST